jgi:hypothetical protein
MPDKEKVRKEPQGIRHANLIPAASSGLVPSKMVGASSWINLGSQSGIHRNKWNQGSSQSEDREVTLSDKLTGFEPIILRSRKLNVIYSNHNNTTAEGLAFADACKAELPELLGLHKQHVKRLRQDMERRRQEQLVNDSKRSMWHSYFPRALKELKEFPDDWLGNENIFHLLLGGVNSVL